MKRFLLLGWPVKHSLSPQMQEAGFRAAGIEASYELLPVPPERLGDEIARIRAAGYDGWNVTVPHKEAVPQYLDWIDPAAAAVGSVNTIINRDGQLSGYSTDGYGLENAVLESFGMALAGRGVFFLGTGGAARACAIHFALRGAARIVLANRTVAKAQAIAAAIGACAPECRTVCLALAAGDGLAAELRRADLLVQATSLGLHAGEALPLPPDLVPPGLPVYDMIYRETPFQAAVRARGCRVADGRGMLLHQGVRSFQLWTGVEAPVAAMRAALEAALARQAATVNKGNS